MTKNNNLGLRSKLTKTDRPKQSKPNRPRSILAVLTVRFS